MCPAASFWRRVNFCSPPLGKAIRIPKTVVVQVLPIPTRPDLMSINMDGPEISSSTPSITGILIHGPDLNRF